MGIKDETIKDIYDLFRFNNLRVVYCPNDALGLDGPFKEVDEHEIVDILNGEVINNTELQDEHFLEGVDLLICGD